MLRLLLVSGMAACHMALSESGRKPRVAEMVLTVPGKESAMTLMQGIKLYPKAILWSVLISSCCAMEGYDIALIGNFCTP
jgi:hypothetical protein